MGKAGAGLLLAAGLALALPADAQNPLGDAEKGAREAIGRLLQSLNRLLEAVPSYQAPEVLPNGDILIRRKRQPPESEPRDEEVLRL
ncbi:MAG: hypothetical protein FJX68_18535 [Alphaproteobacteria bacterium]|nr:hypothetical protein [Alphaproteobacteria bacterium]